MFYFMKIKWMFICFILGFIDFVNGFVDINFIYLVKDINLYLN